MLLTSYDMDGMWRIETIEDEWVFGTRPILWLCLKAQKDKRGMRKRQLEASYMIISHQAPLLAVVNARAA